MWAGADWNIFSGVQRKATTQCGQDDKLGTHCEYDTRRWPDHLEEWQVHQDLLQEWCLKIPTWIWCPGDGKEDASFQRQGEL